MRPSAYESTPRPVLQTALLSANRVCKLLLKEKLAIETSGAKLSAAGSAAGDQPVRVPLDGAVGDGQADSVEALLVETEQDLEDAEVLGTFEASEPLEQSLEQLRGAIEGPHVMAQHTEAEQRLERQSSVAAAVTTSRAAAGAEDEAERALSEVVGSLPVLTAGGQEHVVGGRGVGAKKVCLTQRDQTESTWLS